MLSWMPAFLLGTATAVVLETGLGLLLFVSPGLLPALTAVLTVALAAVGLGLGSRRGRRGRVVATRWRWLLAVGSLLTAAFLSLDWTFQGGIPESAMGRGVNLAFLVALPLYSLGACLAGVAQARLTPRPGAAAVLGGALGVVCVGGFLVPRFEPMSVYLFCLLCLAIAAMGVSVAEPGGGSEGDPWALDVPAP